MNRFLICLLGILLLPERAVGQNSPDCRSAIPVCADSALTRVADGSGDVEDFDPDVIRQTGCLEEGSSISANIENNTSWFVFRAGTGGQIGFDVEALPSATGVITAEWDFALYGPGEDCASISRGDAHPIRCNYGTNNTAYTGIGVNPENGQEGAPYVNGSQNTYDEWLDVQAGEVYYLLINNYNTNFDGAPEAFTLTFTGSSVDADQDTALDCTLRDAFLGLDIAACIGAPDIVLSALNSPAGTDIVNVTWSLDTDGDGVGDRILADGPTEWTFRVSSPDSGRYFVDIEAATGEVYSDDIQITFYGVPGPVRVDVLSELSDSNDVEIVVRGGGSYEYSVNGGTFQDSPVFTGLPPGENTVVVNDTNGCGATGPIPFTVVGYPKFFTPNGDGIHDTWNIQGIETLVDPVVFIFDRYGKLLKQLDETSAGWDGTFNGRPLPSSDYWFRLEYSRRENGLEVAEVLRAHFTLKR